MNTARRFEPVDADNTAMLDWLVEVAREAVPPLVDAEALTMACFPGDFSQAVLALELELSAQRISVLHRHRLSDLLAQEGLPIGQCAVVFDVWSADAAAASLARDQAHAMHLPWRVAVVERGDDVLLLMPYRQPTPLRRATGLQPGRRWSDRLHQCIEHTVRSGCGPRGAGRP